MPGFMEASTTLSVGNPVPAVALLAQPLSVSDAIMRMHMHAPMAGVMPGVWSRLPDPSEFTLYQGCLIHMWDI